MAINRNKLYERCKGLCELCGFALPEVWAAHHRKLRSQGGKDTLDNIVALHHECHNLATHSVHLNPQKHYDKGYLVRSWEDPATTPIQTNHIGTVILTTEGTYETANNNEDVGD